MTHITVPKPPKSAFNPDRPAGSLLRAQILHLEHALGVPESPANRKWTEGAAARYIAELTARLTGRPLPVPPEKPKKRKTTKKASRKVRKPRRR
jgi:hypothetical protein